MESKDSTSSTTSDVKQEPRVVLFGIDLNEIPSSSSSETLPAPTVDAYDVVRSIHGNPRRPFRAVCDLSSEVRDVPCVCGRLEARGGVLVCDGCERWFHLSCAGMRSRQAITLDDWFCGVCLANGVRSKRWQLGAVEAMGVVASVPKKSVVRLLDINASPPSDGEGEETEELQLPRSHNLGENYFSGVQFSTSMTYPTLWYPGTGFDLQRESGMMVHPVKSGPERIVNRKMIMSKSSEDANLNYTHRGRSRGNNTPIRRKELARLSRNSSNQEVRKHGCSAEHSTETEISEPCASSVVSVRAAEVRQERNGGCDSQQPDDGLPVQFEDLLVLCLGKIDSRPSYHNSSQIWPVGYRSSWHDKVTGSLFTCDVLDGGNAGPVFKVRRCPCSTSLIPNGATVLLRLSHGQSNIKDSEKSDEAIVSEMGYAEDTNIQMILSDPSPLEQDLLTCFGGCLSESCELQTKESLTSQDNCFARGFGEPLYNYSGLKDEIGEFLAEGRSSSLVWGTVSDMLVDACREVYKRLGSLQFYCNHALGGLHPSCSDFVDADNKVSVGSLPKFCSSSGPIDIPRVIRGDYELEDSCKALATWLNQDRFGLDMEFVQEIIEQLPGCHACSQYEFLNKRSDHSTLQTVGSGFLLAKRKSRAHGEEAEAVGGLFKACKKARNQCLVQDSRIEVHYPPPGKPLSLKLPAELVGDVLQVCELLWRFYEVLGLKEPLLFEELEEELLNPWFDGLSGPVNLDKNIQEKREPSLHKSVDSFGITVSLTGDSDPTILGENPHKFINIETGSAKEAAQARLASHTYYRCTGVALTKAHSSLLKVLVGELQAKAAALIDPTFDTSELKPRRGRKKDADNSAPMKKLKMDMLPINELTWPELARRYVLAVLSMDGNLDSSEITSRDGIKLFRCLQGDGGMLCGSLTGVGGMEADALLLAGATKQIFGCLSREHDIWPMEDKDIDAVGSFETTTVKDNSVPEWAKVLEPVRKLPTNVGTRIRKCVYEALSKDPPEWAKKILEHSISKEVYKGNASGPTKKAVLSVLADVCSEGPQHKPDKVKKAKSVKTLSDMVMKQCRYVLRHAASADEAKIFCNLLGTTSLNPNDNEDEGILGSPAMVSRPLDFRTVDLRLAAGSYNGSHEAFVEDVREVWQNLCTAFRDQPDLAHVAETLSQNFESLYEKEVLSVVKQVCEHADPQNLSAEVKKELNELVCGHEIPKAPWDEGVCKLCGIDKDDESVLLCDTCDSEYHTYCLNPPLARIPEGNWYCPSCVAGQGKNQDMSKHTHLIMQRRRKRYQGDGTRAFSEALNRLAAAMEEKEYWEFSLEERVYLLKFLCDEVLNSAIIREHIDHCADMSADLQQKLRPLSIELKNLKFKEEIMAARVTKENMLNGIGEAEREGITTMLRNHGRCTGQQQAVNNKYSHGTAFPGNLLDDVPEGNELKNLNRNPCWSFSQSFSENHCNGSRIQSVKLADLVGQTKEVLTVTDNRHMSDNVFPDMVSMKTDESSKLNEPDLINQQSQVDALGEELTSKTTLDRTTDVDMETDDTLQPNVEVSRGSCTSLDIKRTQLAENVALIPDNSDNLFSESHSIVQPGIINEAEVYIQQLDTLKNEISHMQDSIGNMESKLFKLSMRRDFLGRDTAGRMYWALSNPGKFPWLVVDGNMPVQENQSRGKEQGHPYLPYKSKTYLSSREYKASSTFEYGSHDGALELSSWVSYDSDVEVQELVGWLSGSDPKERELKESIYQMQRLRSQNSQQTKNHTAGDCQVIGSRSLSCENAVSPISIATKAVCLLESKYGPCLELETPDMLKKRGRKMKITQEEKMYRCECLEPVWPSRYHCLSCHHTFYTNVELDGHNDGKCDLVIPASDDTKDTDDHSKGKGKMRCETTLEENADEMDVVEATTSGNLDISSRVIKIQKGRCPFNLEDISKKFITNDSNRELVQEIGLIGSNGIPSFVPSTSPYLHDITLVLDSAVRNESDSGVGQITRELVSLHCRALPNLCSDNNSYDLLKRCAGSGVNAEASKAKVQVSECLNFKKDSASSLNKRIAELEVGGHCCIVPESSSRPLVGKVSQILRRLKTNLLDMDAALPEEALRSSKAHSSKRCAWRAFVKSAESIFEMVQATIVFQEMIRTEYLRNRWWYWSSLSAAAKTPTISSLALRIYTLDATIIYQKTLPGLDSSHPTTDIPNNLKLSKKRKDTEG